MDGIYLTWLISALAFGVILLPVFKPAWSKVSAPPFLDFMRRYWIHVFLLVMVYNAKDFLDQIDRILMARTGLDMTPWIYAIEGDLVLWVQETFRASWLDHSLTHFYVAGYMFICYVSIFYMAYFDDRWLADRVALSIFWVYVCAVPFYLFFNVRVTGDHINEMETIAYQLTPEIADWFRRIDPFTNGMPSLHIGIPFAVWLCLLRFDEDNRWLTYRRVLFSYIVLTAFTIIYLGIHWFSDIIGGMAVAAFAVNLAAKTSPVVWKHLDERTMNAQLAVLLATPQIALRNIRNQLSAFISRYTKPTSKETGRMLFSAVIILLMIITYDLTHNSIPAGGVESPERAEAADGWLGVIDNRTNGSVFTLHDLSNLDNIYEIDTIEDLTINSTYSISSNYVALCTNSTVYVFHISEEVNQLQSFAQEGCRDIFVTLSEQRVDILLVTESELIHYSDTLNDVDKNVIHSGSGINAVMKGSEYVFTSDFADFVVQHGSIASEGQTSFSYNASSTVEQEEEMESWGLPVNLSNASVIGLDFDENYILVNVNLTTTDRIVLIDTQTGNSSLVGDPKYSQTEAEIGYGYVVWSSKDNLDPNNPSAEYLDGEIFVMDLENGLTEAITADSIHQTNPIILEDHIVYLEIDSEGESVVRVLTRQVELQTYSNMALQLGVFVLTGLTFLYVWQKQIENRLNLYDNQS